MTAIEFVRKAARRKVRADSALIEHAARTRDCAVQRIGVDTVLVRLGGQWVAFQDMNGPTSSAAAKDVCDDKMATRRLLAAAGLPTPTSRAFPLDGLEEAWAFASGLDGPVVLKPASMAKGRGVSTGLTDREAFVAAWQAATALYDPPGEGTTLVEDHVRAPSVLVEEEVPGGDVRFFVVGERVVSAIERRPASVRGDGRRSVADLIEATNAERVANPVAVAAPIPLEASALDGLAASGRDLADVPEAGEVVVLAGSSRVAAGAASVAVTEAVHPGLAEVAVAALAAVPGLSYGGVDVLASAVGEAPAPGNHVVAEVEFAPGPTAHFPSEGEPRDVAGAILDLYLTHPDLRW